MPIGDWGLRSDELSQRSQAQANEMTVRGGESLGTAIGAAPQMFMRAQMQSQQMQSQRLADELQVAKYEQERQELAWKMAVTSETQRLAAQDQTLRVNEFQHRVAVDEWNKKREQVKENDAYEELRLRQGFNPVNVEDGTILARDPLSGEWSRRKATQDELDWKKRLDEQRRSALGLEAAQTKAEEAKATYYSQKEPSASTSHADERDFLSNLKDQEKSILEQLKGELDDKSPAYKKLKSDLDVVQSRRRELENRQAAKLGLGSQDAPSARPIADVDLPKSFDYLFYEAGAVMPGMDKEVMRRVIAERANKWMAQNPGMTREQAMDEAIVAWRYEVDLRSKGSKR